MRCPKCAADVSVLREFCPHCGTAMDPGVRESRFRGRNGGPAGGGRSIGKGMLIAGGAAALLALGVASQSTGPWFSPTIDGYVLAQKPSEVYAAGRQSRIPLLAGWNADEVRAGVVLGPNKPTAASFTEQTKTRFGTNADSVLAHYPAGSDAEAVESAAALAGDMFVGLATWRWLEAHAKTSAAPVYRFRFDRKIPVAKDTKVNGQPATAADVGARHAGEIEYVFGMLDTIEGVTWPESDRKLSDQIMSYWSNFARSGDPNGPGLPQWPRMSEKDGFPVMHLDETSRAAPDSLRKRYVALDAIVGAPAPSSQPAGARP